MSTINDKKQVKTAEQLEEIKRRQQLNDIRTLLSSASGRRFVWRLLEKCNTFASVYSQNPSDMSYLSGQQDLGHFIMSEVVTADEHLMFKLMKEQKKGEQHVQ